jgi:hypothetical protein
MAATPDGHGGTIKIPGNWRETMSTHWFHEHMLDFTAQNVYKGNAAMMNNYSAISIAAMNRKPGPGRWRAASASPFTVRLKDYYFATKVVP